MEQLCDIVIFAAGSSSRLGSPKQLLEYNQHTLLQHSTALALASLAKRVVVVLGANAAIIQPVVADSRLCTIINKEWEEGIAASIRCGLQYLMGETPPSENVLFMVCDQPYITTFLLDKLITLQRETGKSIAASKYAGAVGIPAIFSKKIFPELLGLTGDTGAKKIIAQYKDDVAAVSFPLGDIDIDTAADYQKLRKMQQKE